MPSNFLHILESQNIALSKKILFTFQGYRGLALISSHFTFKSLYFSRKPEQSQTNLSSVFENIIKVIFLELVLKNKRLDKKKYTVQNLIFAF